MTIEDLWLELEAEVAKGATAAWLTRLALPQPCQCLLVALETVASRRALLLPMPGTAMPAKHEWPDCHGLEVFSVAFAGQPHFGVRLRDTACADVFTALAEDVAPRVAAAPDARSAATVFIGRLRRWQRFLSAGKRGLSPEQQRGLYGELHTLRTHLLPSQGTAESVNCWRAPEAAHQDFQFAAGSVEVKTTTAKQPQLVRIASERQLDDTGIPALFLHVVVLDERVIDAAAGDAGESLPRIVASMRKTLAGESGTLDRFDDCLLESGYLEADAPRYEARRFTVRSEHTFRVTQGFPRVTENLLLEGVGNVTYDLSLAACNRFSVPIAAMLTAIRKTTSANTTAGQ